MLWVTRRTDRVIRSSTSTCYHITTPAANLFQLWSKPTKVTGRFSVVREITESLPGHIVGLASMASFFTIGETSDYAATKAGVLAFHEGLSQELKHRYKAPNVHSTVVHPSWARTAIVGTKFPEDRLGKLMEPNVVSDAILKQIFSARGGQIILPPNLYFVSMLRAFPNWVQELIRDDKGKLCNEEVTMEVASSS